MNILIISCVFPPEPVVSAKLSYDLATKLTHNGNQVSVISPKPTRPLNFKFKSREIKSAFKHEIMNSFTSPKSYIIGRMRESYSFGKKCSNYIKNNHHRIDTIYINSWPLFSQYLIIKTAKKYNIPTVVHVQDIYPESISNKLKIGGPLLQKIFQPIDKYILANANKIICISENMKMHLSKTRKLLASKFQIVSNWQDEDSFIDYKENKSMEDQAKGGFSFMYLGNNGPVAGVDFLIKSFEKAAIENSQLIIAGSGSRTDACKKLVKDLGINNVVFIPVPDGKVPEVQAQADVMLLPVKTGGAMSSIPSKLPAYMLSAKPIIGSLDLKSDTANAIVEAKCGIVVEPENEDYLVGAMREIRNFDKNKLIEMGENGFSYAMRNFSKSYNLEKIVNIITEI
jgi:glycosyltransferase involved in cell wall biosynthesis